ncbi:MAG: biopolymer transporter ExbD [Burkholderiaceae bacterium]
MAGAIRLSRSKRLRVLSLTPLIDVVFMLLLFFMLAPSFSRWSTVELVTTVPDSAAATPELASAVLTVLEKHLLYDKVPMTLESFFARLNAESIPLSRTVVVGAADTGPGSTCSALPRGTVSGPTPGHWQADLHGAGWLPVERKLTNPPEGNAAVTNRGEPQTWNSLLSG